MNHNIRSFPILLPKNVDMSKWAVVACDQFNAEKDYWYRLADYVGAEPSTLKLIYPEAFLANETTMRTADINATMKKYLNDDIFRTINNFILVERTVEGGKKRIGLMVCIDIEKYNFERVNVPIRATEDTIIERLPVRVNIRKDAEIELPHTLLLIDDEKKDIIEPLYAKKNTLKKLYDFDMNMGGGHICGYEVPVTEELLNKFDNLLDKNIQIQKYGCDAGIQFAVGDGNHSVATAKVYWNDIKKGLSEKEQENHPARYFLLEVMNIYDDALIFEPIHRAVTVYDDKFLQELKENLNGTALLRVLMASGETYISCPRSPSECITKVQKFLENYRIENPNMDIEYVHGDNHLEKVVTNNKNIVGIFLPKFEKDELFRYVVNVGNLPKKAFSIGSAENKRYYLESKKIR